MGQGASHRDGHTIVLVATPLVINPSLYGTVPYDPIKDFDPVTLAVSTTTVLAIHPSVPAQTTRDLVAVIRANPGKYSFSSPGTGTPSLLLGELFRLSLKLDLVHVPFNSGGLAIGSTLAGHTPLCFGTPPPALPHLKDGKLRALAVTSKARVPTLPDVPTMAEAGYPDIEGVSWFAVAVPAGTPKEIIALLNREIVKIMALPDIKEHLATLGFDSIASSPEEFGERIRADFEKWGQGDPGGQYQSGVGRARAADYFIKFRPAYHARRCWPWIKSLGGLTAYSPLHDRCSPENGSPSAILLCLGSATRWGNRPAACG